MEFSILYALQGMRSAPLDGFVLLLTRCMGSYGQIWLIAALLLLLYRRTRKCASTMLIGYVLVLLVGQYLLKDWIARPRPCQIDQAVELLVTRPSSFSFPSTHTAWAFAAATAIFLQYRKPGFVVLLLAALIGLSRMYLFVHFPTDVLAGVVLGVAAALLAKAIVERALSNVQKMLPPDKQKNA